MSNSAVSDDQQPFVSSRGSETRGLKSYVPEIDALRAVAALAVVLQHCGLLPIGWMGVWLFFVISGFAITSSLRKSDAQAIGTWRRILNFFVRRSIRIWPIYFLYVFACAAVFIVVGAEENLGNLPYLFTFTFNLKMIFDPVVSDHASAAIIGHLWTISVEEQFYIAYPFLFFFLNRERFKHVLLACILMGPLIRWVFALWIAQMGWSDGRNAFAIYALSITHFDAFAIGCALSLSRETLVANKNLSRRILLFGLLVAIAHVCVYVGLNVSANMTGVEALKGVVSGTLWGQGREVFVYCAVVYVSAGIVALVLAEDPLVLRLCRVYGLQFLGRISYGIYLYHALVLYFVNGVYDQVFQAETIILNIPKFFVVTAVSVLVAHLSYRFIESPISRLRKRFP